MIIGGVFTSADYASYQNVAYLIDPLEVTHMTQIQLIMYLHI